MATEQDNYCWGRKRFERLTTASKPRLHWQTSFLHSATFYLSSFQRWEHRRTISFFEKLQILQFLIWKERLNNRKEWMYPRKRIKLNHYSKHWHFSRARNSWLKCFYNCFCIARFLITCFGTSGIKQPCDASKSQNKQLLDAHLQCNFLLPAL